LVEKVKIMLVENVMGESVGGKSESLLNILVAESVSNSHLSADQTMLKKCGSMVKKSTGSTKFRHHNSHDNRQQTTDNRQQTTDNRQQTTDNRQQTTLKPIGPSIIFSNA